MCKHRTERRTALLAVLSLGLLAVAAWGVVTGSGEVAKATAPAGRSLEGIWTTMVPVGPELASINSFVITAQGSEGLMYTVVGKHPQCSPTLLGYFPQGERLSDMMGYCVRTNAESGHLSILWHSVKEGGPESMGIGEIVFMGVLSGTVEFIGADALQFAGTISAYAPDQDADGDRLPDEGAVPVLCVPADLTLKRLPMPPSCEPMPLPAGVE